MSKMAVNQAFRKVGCTALMLVGFTAVGGIARAQSAAAPGNIALEGYCAVCVVESQKWVAGSPQHQIAYDGKTY